MECSLQYFMSGSIQATVSIDLRDLIPPVAARFCTASPGSQKWIEPDILHEKELISESTKDELHVL